MPQRRGIAKFSFTYCIFVYSVGILFALEFWPPTIRPLSFRKIEEDLNTMFIIPLFNCGRPTVRSLAVFPPGSMQRQLCPSLNHQGILKRFDVEGSEFQR